MRGFVFLILILCLVAPLHPSFAGDKVSFDSLKPLAGNWQGKTSQGKTVSVNYELISGGTALLEKMSMDPEHMVTTYYPDGNGIVLTHYCMANNQPRMRSEASSTPDRIVFKFIDATNLSAPDAGHMHQMVMSLKDQDHLSQEWTWVEKGKEHTEAFQLERVR